MMYQLSPLYITDLFKYQIYSVKMRSVVLFINKYKSNVIKCQRFIRAFLNAKRLRQKEMSKQWDQVARDIIGEDAGRHWMFRLLNSAKMDENGKAVPDKDATSGLRLFKEERILIEVRRLRKQYLLNRDEYKEIVKVFKAKLELCHQVSSMGLDSVATHPRTCMVPYVSP